MSKLVKNTIVYSIGNVFPKAAGFILLPIYAKYLDPAEFGIVGSMETIKVFLFVLFSFNIENGIMRLYWDFKSDSDQRTFLGTSVISIFIISTIVLALLYFLSGSIEKIYVSIDFYPYYSYTILTSFFIILTQVPNLYFRLKEQAIKFVSLSILSIIANNAFIVYFIFDGQGAAGYLKGQMLGAGLFALLYIYYSISIIKFRYSFSVLKKILAFTLPTIPPVMVTWVVNQSSRIFIERYLALDDVGVYYLATKIASLITISSVAIILAFEPIFFKLANSTDTNLAKKKLSKFNTVYFVLLIFSSFVIALISKEVIILFFDQEYYETHLYVPLILLANMFALSAGVTSFYFKQSKKMLAVMYISFAVGGINVLMNFILIPLFALYGAVFSLIITLAFSFTALYLYAKKYCYFIPFNWSTIILLVIPFTIILAILNYSLGDINIIISIFIKLGVILICGLLILLNYKTELSILFLKKKKQ
jgi:O-antigen/teichoic acid export membrane protein